MAEDPAEIEAFGRKVAASYPGFDAHEPGFEAYRYGRIARYSIGRGKGVPDPREFVGGTAEIPRAAAIMGPVPDERRHVRVGQFDLTLSDATPARNRPQHHLHRSQRSQGRYRRRMSRSWLTSRSTRRRYRR